MSLAEHTDAQALLQAGLVLLVLRLIQEGGGRLCAMSLLHDVMLLLLVVSLKIRARCCLLEVAKGIALADLSHHLLLMCTVVVGLVGRCVMMLLLNGPLVWGLYLDLLIHRLRCLIYVKVCLAPQSLVPTAGCYRRSISVLSRFGWQSLPHFLLVLVDSGRMLLLLSHLVVFKFVA